MSMDVIDYDIFGEEMQYVEIELDPGEAAIGEAGAMMMMEDGIQMDTTFGDGSQDSGLMSRLLGAGKRLLTGESLFTTIYHNEDKCKRRVAFAAPYPGKIIPINLANLGGTFICQKDSFLCAARGVSLGIAFQQRFGSALFGGEGFILQKLDGDGMAFIHAGGTLLERTLAPGELLRVDTGCVVGFQPGVTFDIEYVGKLKSAIFGGEGLFFATLSGPGKVWLQTLPISRLAGRILAYAPQTGSTTRGEGSILGSLGNLLDGDG
ncbi:MAG: TIGR00266 family protein [Gammaproteobacteria bacterium]